MGVAWCAQRTFAAANAAGALVDIVIYGRVAGGVCAAGVDGHNVWWSASIRKPLHERAGAEPARAAPKRGRNKWNTVKKSKSKLARAWQGWYKLDFTSFICNDAFDLRDAATKNNLRLGDRTKTL